MEMTRLPRRIGRVKFTQPVLIEKLKEIYDDLPRPPKTPAVPGQVLVMGDGSGQIEGKEATRYRSGTATTMFMMQWLRPEVYNTTRGLVRQMAHPRLAHVAALKNLISYIVSTLERGLVLLPDTI